MKDLFDAIKAVRREDGEPADVVVGCRKWDHEEEVSTSITIDIHDTATFTESEAFEHLKLLSNPDNTRLFKLGALDKSIENLRTALDEKLRRREELLALPAPESNDETA